MEINVATIRWTRWCLGALLSPFVLFILLTLLIYCPPVQRWAVGVAMRHASEATGMEIKIHDVALRFPLDLQLNGISALKRNGSIPQRKDTLLIARSVVCDIQMMPLFKGKVEVDILQLDAVRLNTMDMIADCRVDGRVGQAVVKMHGVDLKHDSVIVNTACLTDADLDICLSDTAQKDTTESKTAWVVAIEKASVANSRVMLHLPGDTLNVEARVGDFAIDNALLDLAEGVYSVRDMNMRRCAVRYDNRFEPRIKGMDYNHLSFTEMNVGLDSLYYSEAGMKVRLRTCNMKEKSGFALNSLTFMASMDAACLHVRDFNLMTPFSSVSGDVDFDFTTFDKTNPGKARADMKASIGKDDVMLFAGEMLPRDLKRQLPKQPITLRAKLEGNMQRCRLSDVYADVPALLRLTLDGDVCHLDQPDKLTADVKLDANVFGNGGRVSGTARFSAEGMAYNAALQASGVNVNRFLPGSGFKNFSGRLNVSGKGTDIFSPATRIDADVAVANLNYKQWNFAGAKAECSIRNGRAKASLHSDVDILSCELSLDALINTKRLAATLAADIRNIDLHALRITPSPLSTGVCCHVDIDTDLGDNILLNGHLSDIRITDSAQVFHPDDIAMDVLTRRDTTHAVVNCGDFHLRADASGGYRRLMRFTDDMTKEMKRQMDERIIDELALRSKLPDATLYLSSGMENPMARLLSRFGYEYSNIYANLSSSPVRGLDGIVQIDTLKTPSMQLDEIRFDVSSDIDNTSYVLKIANGKDNPQYCFTAQLSGEMLANGSSATLTIDDKDGRRGIDIGLSALMEADGIRMKIAEREQILGYRAFMPNDGNYVFLGKGMRVSADLKLQANDGTGVQIYTNDDNLDALQDITLTLHKLDIAGLLSIVPYTPDITGVLDGDFHAIISEHDMSISSDVRLQNLCYEGCQMGNISSEIVYMPQADGSHHVDGILYKDEKEVASIVGTYYFRDEDYIDAEISLDDLPMNLVNGFVPGQIIGMDGYGNGTLSIKGKVSEPVVDGTIDLSKAMFISVPYGVVMTIDEDPVKIVGSNVLFDNFSFYDKNKRPMVMNGYCDFSQLDNIMMNLGIKGEGIQLIDAKETRRSEAYGKAFVNFYALVSGYADRLNVKARLDVLPSTNLYYILRDSPITTDNRLKELVEFTDFRNDNYIPKELPKVDGMSVDFRIGIREGAHITCWLNTNHSNYLDIMGSGDLRMIYADDALSMTGRYTISEGEMKYSLPVIPLKTFSISEDSYIEFVGDIMNPRLNITATEKMRSGVSENGESRTVEFTCGVVITKTLQDMGLQFIIDAPEDQQTADALNTMSVEERGKVAVTMLTTGMYLSDTNTSNITMNSALSSFLQQEINNIAGTALRTLDLSVGLENTTNADGTVSMDYSFKFAKRFWNNRVSVSLGGRISTGSSASGKTPSFFDNVEVQYRLSDTSNQYLRLFYKHDVYDYLEGYLDQYGAGYMWKRKLQNFKDIFSFRTKTETKTKTDTKPDTKTNTSAKAAADSATQNHSEARIPNDTLYNGIAPQSQTDSSIPN